MSRKVSHGLIVFSILLIGAYAYAQPQVPTRTLRVTHPFSFDEYLLELPAGETGDITIYLKSVGEDVEGYKIYLVRTLDKKAIQSAVTNGAGEVTFFKVPPGDFAAVLRISARTRRETTIEIGDITVTQTNPDSVDPSKSERLLVEGQK